MAIALYLLGTAALFAICISIPLALFLLHSRDSESSTGPTPACTCKDRNQQQ